MRARGTTASLFVALGLVGLAVVGTGCKREKSEDSGAPAASASGVPAPVASGVPIPLEQISRAVNPKGAPAYSGPTATVRGVVRITGDEPPEQPEILEQIPSDCAGARAVYGRLFRRGPAGELADALVAVTGYPHYVPEKEAVHVVPASGCAWESRTIAVTFGQRIEIEARDPRPYVPELLGGRMPAQLVALPGARSMLYPKHPGRYLLVDSLRLFSTAEVVVLKYATHDVTTPDGRYEIRGIPAGTVTLNAFSPQSGAETERTLTLKPGQTLELDLELRFDAEEYRRALAGSQKPAPPGSAAPATSASAAPNPEPPSSAPARAKSP